MMATSTSNAPPASPAADPPSQPATSSQRETTSIDVPSFLPIKVTLQDHALPKSVIVRLAKSVLPENTMIQKEAVTALVKSATVFINYLAATANDITQQKGKKTINNEEVLSALEVIDFDAMIPQLKTHIEQFDVARKEKRKKAEQDEQERKKRKIEGDIADEIAVETNGDDAETELEKATEDGDSVDDADEPEDEQEEEDEADGEVEEEEQEIEGEGESVVVDMEENEEVSEEEEFDEALAEDSD